MGRSLLSVVAVALAAPSLMCTSFEASPEGPSETPDASEDAQTERMPPPPPPADAGDAGEGAAGFHPCGDIFGTCGRMAFVTSGTISSMMGGIAAADAFCQEAAHASPIAAVKSRFFRAWLSDATVEAKDRFPNDGPIFRPDLELAATSFAQLLSGTFELELAQDELDNNIVGVEVWTGTANGGTRYSADPLAASCGSWTGAGATARVGISDAKDSRWTSNMDRNCTLNTFHLYCLEW